MTRAAVNRIAPLVLRLASFLKSLLRCMDASHTIDRSTMIDQTLVSPNVVPVWHPCAGSIEAALSELDMDRYNDEEATNGGRIFGSGNPGMAFYRCALALGM